MIGFYESVLAVLQFIAPFGGDGPSAENRDISVPMHDFKNKPASRSKQPA